MCIGEYIARIGLFDSSRVAGNLILFCRIRDFVSVFSYRQLRKGMLPLDIFIQFRGINELVVSFELDIDSVGANTILVIVIFPNNADIAQRNFRDVCVCDRYHIAVGDNARFHLPSQCT